jgi:hypothetical protein
MSIDPALTARLGLLIEEAAKLQAVLNEARSKKDAAQAVIDANISDFVAAKSRIMEMTDRMVYDASEDASQDAA